MKDNRYNLFQDLWNRFIILGGGAGSISGTDRPIDRTGRRTARNLFLEALCGISEAIWCQRTNVCSLENNLNVLLLRTQ